MLYNIPGQRRPNLKTLTVLTQKHCKAALNLQLQAERKEIAKYYFLHVNILETVKGCNPTTRTNNSRLK